MWPLTRSSVACKKRVFLHLVLCDGIKSKILFAVKRRAQMYTSFVNRELVEFTHSRVYSYRFSELITPADFICALFDAIIKSERKFSCKHLLLSLALVIGCFSLELLKSIEKRRVSDIWRRRVHSSLLGRGEKRMKLITCNIRTTFFPQKAAPCQSRCFSSFERRARSNYT